MEVYSYLGPRKTFTEKAAEQASKNDEEAELIPEASIDDVVMSVKTRKATRGIMAYYNMLDGLVQRNLDMIFEHGLKIVGATRVCPVVFSLGEHKHNKNRQIVYSHEKGHGQCSQYYSRHKGIVKKFVSSTAEAAKIVAETKEGLAVASKEALEARNLVVLEQDITDVKGKQKNYTDFFTVMREEDAIEMHEDGKKYLTMVAILPHFDRIGLLDDILSQFRAYRINVEKIHSRPSLAEVQSRKDAQMFYLEIAAEEGEKRTRKCLDASTYLLNPKQREIEVVRVLGSYEKLA